MIEENELPQGWTKAKIDDIATLIGGSTPSRKEPHFFGGDIVWLTPTEIPKGTVSYISTSREKLTTEGFNSSGVHLIPKGSVLLTSRASIGYVAIADTQLTTNQGFASFVLPQQISSNYFAWWLKSQKSNLENLAGGTTFKEISKATIKEIYTPIAPLPEQQRIVEAIEQQFSRLDAGVEYLRSAQKKLKLYRASVLKAAVEGELTAEWRKNNPATETAAALLERILKERRERWEEDLRAKGKDPKKVKYVEPAEPNVGELGELPEGWCWATNQAISTRIVDGVHKKPNYVDCGIPFVTVRNLTAGPNISFDKLNYITREDHNEFIKRAHPEKGDILISKDGTLGVVRLIKTDNVFSIFVSVALIKPVVKDISTYLSMALSSTQIQAQMVHKGSGLQHIHLEDLRIVAVPLPPLAEQEQIVTIVEERMSIINELEATIEKALKRAERQRQSILQQAFTGRLVEQDPNDEPASVLLERIQQERAVSEAAKTRAKVKAVKKERGEAKKKKAQQNATVLPVPPEAAEPIEKDALVQQDLWAVYN